ncbi:cullin 1 [Artemisia annua]|uniref:Cullin 1 n=1 Tax=Artemisia annua TaxID=35608 RepID=A0A2U1LQG5_ARTAN|nr:cullin 1 [Artemisia annua]
MLVTGLDPVSRMYRLFSKVPTGLDPVSNMFKEHVTTGGTELESLFSFSRISPEREHLISLGDFLLAYVHFRELSLLISVYRKARREEEVVAVLEEMLHACVRRVTFS